MSQATLLKYNFRVVMFNNWWLLVFPVAVSQLSVFWTMITQKMSPALPSTTAELVTPLLSAFLCAHLLTAEYPSRVGAIIASKPLHIGKVVALRIISVLMLVWILEWLSLAAFYYGMESFPIFKVFAVTIPGTLFLSMLALTFATRLRHPLAGFGIAALYWIMDLPSTASVNPFLSIRSYSVGVAATGPLADSLTQPWWIAKLILMVGAVLLYAYHGKLIFGLGTPVTLKARRRALFAALGMVVFYVVSGASSKVIVGYSNRGSLYPNDGAWFRRQFSVYSPIPVSAIFGSGFRAYIGDVPSGWVPRQEGDSELLGDSSHHRLQLTELIDRSPQSIWAPSAMELYARLIARDQPSFQARAKSFRRVADQYPDSPYVDTALKQTADAYDASNNPDDARGVFEELLKKRPNTRFRSDAIRYIMESERKANRLDSAEKWAREWVRIAPMEERPPAWLALAEILKVRGNIAESIKSAEQSMSAAKEFQAILNQADNSDAARPRTKWEKAIETSRQRAEQLRNELRSSQPK